MSDLKPEPISGETGTLGTGPAAPEMSVADVPVTAAADIESPRLAPEQEETSPKADVIKPDAPRVEMPKVEEFKVEAVKPEAPKVDAPKVDAVKPEAPRFPGKVIVMSPGERVGAKAEAASAETSSGKRRMSAMAAVVALATVAGALGGALATAGLGHLMSNGETVAASANTGALEASIARIDADIVALKAGAEHTSKVATGQFNKTSDRLDKVEKAQVEPAAKLARLSEAVEKLRAAPPSVPVAAAAPVAARDVTGSVSQPATVAAAAPSTTVVPPKPDVGRLPKLEGWVLRDVGNGGALIEGRQGIFEVYAGDPVPGLGHVDAIRKQDGKWVVVTSKGLISR